MLPLLKQTVRYCFRTRLVWLVFGLGFLIQWMGLTMISHMQVRISGHLEMGPALKGPEFLFAALLLQFFVGTFLSAVYGIWSIPYMHRGDRAVLTFVLPVQKWKYPLAYAAVFLMLVVALHGVMLISYGLQFGFASLMTPDFPWTALLLSLVMESLAFLVMTSGFALCSLVLGAVPTFFVGTGFLFILQVSALLHRLEWAEALRTKTFFAWYFRLYELLPPIGDLVFDVWNQFRAPNLAGMNLPAWVIWFGVLSGLFVTKLLYPGKAKPVEN